MHFAFSSCVKNDLPYPVVRLSITGFEVNGQIGSAVINNEERTVTVDLLDSVDLKKVIVTRFDYSEEANTDLKVNTTIDLSSPKEVVLSLYQDLSLEDYSQPDPSNEYLASRIRSEEP